MKTIKKKHSLNNGLIIGKFMPLHSGHLNLIKFGLENCNNITILLVASHGEPIDPELRYAWLKEYYKSYTNIFIDVIYRDDINRLPQEKRTAAWCKLIEEKYTNIDSIVSSETYGDILAKHLNIKHLKFDHKREITPISATEIRKNFSAHMHYLPDNVKSFFKEGQK